MDQALLQDDAAAFVPLDQGTVVMPQNVCAVVQVGGRTLEREAVTLEDNLPQ